MAILQSLADAPGNQREYETIYILAPETLSDGIASVNDRVKGVIESMGGRVINVDNWGKRRLAYNIKKQSRGIYLYWQYLGTSGLVEELERNLRMLDTCIRYMTVKLNSDIDPSARPSELDDEAYTRAATPAVEQEEYDAAGGDDDDRDGDDDDRDGDADATVPAADATAADATAADATVPAADATAADATADAVAVTDDAPVAAADDKDDDNDSESK